MVEYLKGHPFELSTEDSISSTLKTMKGSITELKAFSNPPVHVLKTL